MYSQYQSLSDLPPGQQARLADLDPNIPSLIKVIETLPRDGEHYFSVRNLLAGYIKVLLENQMLREKGAPEAQFYDLVYRQLTAVYRALRSDSPVEEAKKAIAALNLTVDRPTSPDQTMIMVAINEILAAIANPPRSTP